MPARSYRRRTAALMARITATFAQRSIRPFVAFLNVTRRCNLSCGYCREYDHTSPPVPLATLEERVGHLARLGTAIVTLNGGEPLTHPEIVRVVRAVREHRMAATLNTNGFLLDVAHVEAFNLARLSAMQVSVDGLEPNDVTQKSFRTLAPKLRLLSRRAKFPVHVNAVVGAGADAAELARLSKRVTDLGLFMKVALLRAEDGSVSPDLAVSAPARSGLFGRVLVPDEQLRLARGERLDWKCRAGARYLHVCDQGLVHLCGVKLGSGTVPLADYTAFDVEAAFRAPKPCAPRCGVAYAHGLSRLDAHRSQGREADRVRLPVVS